MLFTSSFILTLLSSPVAATEWSGWGGNLLNNRWASTNRRVSSKTIGSLSQHCRLTYQFGVSATPVIDEDTVYYPTWNGSLVALDYVRCQVKWQGNVTDLVVRNAPSGPLHAAATFIRAVSRSSPQIEGGYLFFGTLRHALLIAVDKNDGRYLDSIRVNAHPFAIVTMSPTVYKSHVFIGTSSSESEGASQVPGYVCCSYIGNMAGFKWNRRTKKFSLAWDLPMLPTGWSGVGVWGSQPAVDKARNQVYFATGNVYRNPPEFDKCLNQSASCLPPGNHQESIIAAEVETGRINWKTQLVWLDAWTLACGQNAGSNPLCSNIPPRDADFGMAPALIKKDVSKLGEDILTLGQKNGILYSLSAETGKIRWAKAAGPGSEAGGLSWGVAADDSRVYFSAINPRSIPYTIKPSGLSINNSAFSAASLADGAILWQTQVPNNSISLGPPTIVRDLILIARTGVLGTGQSYDNTRGGLVVLQKETGKIVSNIELDANFHSTIAVQDEYILFGTGYGQSYRGLGSFYVMKVATAAKHKRG